MAGVIKDYPAGSEFIFDYLLPGTPGTVGGGTNRYTTYIKLHKGSDVKKLKEKTEGLRYRGESTFYIRDSENWRFRLRSLPEVHFTCNHELEGRFRNIRMLVWAGVLAFISALINHLVLFIGQQRKRALHNHALSVIGAGTGSLLWKSVCELLFSLIVAFIGVLVLIELVFPFFSGLYPSGWGRRYIYKICQKYWIWKADVCIRICFSAVCGYIYGYSNDPCGNYVTQP
ncbi:MAG: hypothetical protein LUD15_06460 [Bacteroides sp.]|nr:hypothetical protein [Bacteroides sp.]